MKKTIPTFIITLLLLGSGCETFPKASYNTPEKTPGNLTIYEDQEFAALVKDIKKGGTKNTNTTTNMNNKNQEQTEGDEFTLENLWPIYNRAKIKTNFGDIVVEFYGDESPITVNNFLNLAKKDFYNNTKFHRVIKNFMIQGGDPLSKDNDPTNDGTGGPGYYFIDEINNHKLIRGSLAMANAGPNTNGSQFFIVTAEATNWLDGKHTNFGHVVEGMDVVQKIEAMETGQNDRPIQDVVVLSVELIER